MKIGTSEVINNYIYDRREQRKEKKDLSDTQRITEDFLDMEQDVSGMEEEQNLLMY